MGEVGTLKYTPIFGDKFPQMHLLEDLADTVPTVFSFHLYDTHQKQRQPAEQNMAADSFLFAVIDGSEIQGGLQRSKGPLYLMELFIAQGDLLSCEAEEGMLYLEVTYRYGISDRHSDGRLWQETH